MQLSAFNLDDITWLHTELAKHYKVRNLGLVKRFLGMNIY
jgi:hypothetical protein